MILKTGLRTEMKIRSLVTHFDVKLRVIID